MPTPQPQRFDRGPANWTGPQLAASPERWIHNLTAGEIANIDALVCHARREQNAKGLVDVYRQIGVYAGPILKGGQTSGVAGQNTKQVRIACFEKSADGNSISVGWNSY